MSARSERYEDRANWCCCFPPRNPRTEHPPAFTGITMLDGRKHWVNVYEKTDRNGNRFLLINIKPVEQQPTTQAAPRKGGWR